MAKHPLGLLLVWTCLGCQSVEPFEPPSETNIASVLWQKGQEAMRRGQPDQAIVYYERSLTLDPTLVRSHLSLAAAYLEQGDDAAACTHLGHYVHFHPDQLAVRVHLADLTLRLHRLREARHEFECCVAGAQDQREAGSLIHCHARLMEIAEEAEDEYNEHLHRGIGLCLLARQRARLEDPDGDLPLEGLLCKAAGELTLAHSERPEEARPNCYLYEVWSMLDQRKTAQRCLSQAIEAAPFSDLTATEKRALQVQCQCVAGIGRVK